MIVLSGPIARTHRSGGTTAAICASVLPRIAAIGLPKPLRFLADAAFRVRAGRVSKGARAFVHVREVDEHLDNQLGFLIAMPQLRPLHRRVRRERVLHVVGAQLRIHRKVGVDHPKNGLLKNKTRKNGGGVQDRPLAQQFEEESFLGARHGPGR